MNTALFRFINSGAKNPFLDGFLPVFSDKDYVVIPGIVALGLMLCFGGRRARMCVFALAIALLIADAGSEKLIKNFFAEERPYRQLEDVNVYRGNHWEVYTPSALDERQSNAFPSTHAANIAAIAVALGLFYRRSLWGTIPVMLLVGLSRVYTGNHFPADVLGGYVWGGACGYFLAMAVPRVTRRVWGEAPERAVPAPMPKERKAFLWLLGAWCLLNYGFLFMNVFDLAGDEAQYWDWSRRTALGYYSKPPMVAYVDGIFAGAGGNKEWSLRSGALLFTAGGLALVYALTQRIAKSDRAALIAAGAAMALPATWAGSVLMTIDPLLLFFWALAMYTFYRAVNGENAMWWWTGLALGLGMLSKYTMLFLYLPFAAYLVIHDRKRLRTSGPYIALFISILCLSGVIYWNWKNGWVSVVHTVSIGADSKRSAARAVKQFLEYFGAQAGLVSPIVFGGFAWAMWRCGRRFLQSRDAAYLFLCAMTVFVFYAAVALTRPPQANWPVTAYIAMAVAFGWLWSERPRSSAMRKTLAAGLALGCVLGIAPRCSGLLYAAGAEGPREDRLYLAGRAIDPDRDPTNRLRGARELGAALSKHLVGAAELDPFIFSDRYQLTAQSAFYTKGRPRTYCMNSGDRRFNQYDLWGGWDKLIGRDGLFVTGGDEVRANLYISGMVQAGAFESGEVLEIVKVWRGKTLIKTYTISRMHSYKGANWNPSVEKY
ncbi:MAG: glycosyltransferase family 39 protein [Candidatus Hydrogenedentes bacterium]|nr:glycosyltransferase family 39 protein [Candidatus Hydrogenedentota bacterium]